MSRNARTRVVAKPDDETKGCGRRVCARFAIRLPLSAKGTTMDIGSQLARGQDSSNKLAVVYQKRLRIAQERYTEAVKAAYAEDIQPMLGNGAASRNLLSDWQEY